MSIKVSVKIMLALGLVITCCLVVTLAQRNNPNSRDSHDPMEMALNDKRVMRRLMKCLLEQGPCDLIAPVFKKLIPLMLRDSCPRCVSHELLPFTKIVERMAQQYPEEWSQIRIKYAPA